MTEVKKFTLLQVKEHNKETDLWIIIRDKVYDVTKFLNEHPGGDEVLKEVAGKEATKGFDDAGHSDVAIEQLATYYIGDIVDEEKKFNKQSTKNICLGVSSAAAIGLGAFLVYKGYKLFKST